MTDAFYVAVKGSLHASDSSVFGLNNEELAAISKRFGNARKEVINGILIKANPLEVINVLSELGYRVACSSGEAEMVWTLRREVLDSRSAGARVPPPTGRRSIPTPRQSVVFEERQEPKVKPPTAFTVPMFKAPERPEAKIEKPPVQRLGTKPKDLETFGYEGSRILVIDPDEVENFPEDQKIIIKTNLNSEDNPMLDPWLEENPYYNNNINNTDRRPSSSRNSQIYAAPEIKCNKMSCTRPPPVPSVHQTMEEMDFERGLWYPALTGDLPRLKELIRKGRNPDEEDNNGYSALHYGARCGFTTICTALLEAGASVNKATRAGGSTPLHRAALAGHDDTIVVLIKYGANLLAKDADGRTPLHRAVEANHPASVAILLEAAPESTAVKDRAGKTARHYVKTGDRVMNELFDVVENTTNLKVPATGSSNVTSATVRSKSPATTKKDDPSSNRDSTSNSLSKKSNSKDRSTEDKKSPNSKNQSDKNK